jgi:hypothetical protein
MLDEFELRADGLRIAYRTGGFARSLGIKVTEKTELF